MAKPTAPLSRKFALLLIVFASATGCRHEPAEEAYRHTWSLYAAGNLSQAASDCTRNASLFTDRRSPWYWKFRLFEAEILIAQGKMVAAEALLKDAVPLRFESGQLEVRRLVDQAILRADRKDEAKALLERARHAVTDPELTIRIRIAEGRIAWIGRQFQAAHLAYGEAAKMAARQSMPYLQAQALASETAATKNLGLYEETLEIGHHALNLAEQIGAHRLAAVAHSNLGPVYSYLGEAETVADRFRLGFPARRRPQRSGGAMGCERYGNRTADGPLLRRN
ncbi:MAG TPA: hypothetical protein VKJ01_18010, partial [Candidatus Solibacter sp.]|nr:hypothetical protein [Candidatus Solibacter sp.]